VLQRIDPAQRYVQALIMEPTRELAQQTFNVITAIGDKMGVKTLLAVGGAQIASDAATLRKGVHVVIGTPGRVQDLVFNRRILSVKSLKVIILDEADQMLSQGFLDDIQNILAEIPQDAQVGLFSATLPPDALEISEKFMKNPLRIILKRGELPLEGIRQFYIMVHEENFKLDTVCDLFDSVSVSQCVIFCNTRRKADWLADKMTLRQFPVACLHSDMEASARSSLMADFWGGRSRVLVTTDLLARGIDVSGVSAVINYDVPRNMESYLHRIGRGGRFGKKGVAINMVTDDEVRTVREIEQFYDTAMEELPSNFGDFL